MLCLLHIGVEKTGATALAMLSRMREAGSQADVGTPG